MNKNQVTFCAGNGVFAQSVTGQCAVRSPVSERSAQGDPRRRMKHVTERQKRLLARLVERYVEANRPIPSATLAADLGVSPATVRYDLADLEALGLVEKPHASAGRVPTELGLRTYALGLLPPEPLPEQTARVLSDALARAGQDWPRLAAQMASRLARYPAVLRLLPRTSPRILRVHLSPLAGRRVLAVAVLEGGRLREGTLLLPFEPSEALLAQAEEVLKKPRRPEELAELKGSSPQMDALFRALAGALGTARGERFFEGVSEVFSEPEASDPGFLRRLLALAEEPSPGPLAPPGGVNLRLEEGTAVVQVGFARAAWRGEVALLGPGRMRYRDALSVAYTLGSVLGGEHAD